MTHRLLFMMVLIVGCTQAEKKIPTKKLEITLSNAEIEQLLMGWKKDSLGCLRIRNPEKMKAYANQLVGVDSLELIRQLGRPSYRYGRSDTRHFAYVLECPKDRPSYYNFYFHFNGDTVEWFSNPVMN